MKTIISLLCCLSVCRMLTAQPVFIQQGKIVYESKLNLEKEWEKKLFISLEKRKSLPKYYTTLHNLYFTKDKTLYEKNPATEPAPYYEDDVNLNDITYSDLKAGTFVKKQAVYEETVLLSDSIRKVDWEMTNEVRTIAGFVCHKATAVILDSIYVIAFYTDEIQTPGGPLSYTHLPGMILGVVIPRMNLTIFATKVELGEAHAAAIRQPTAKTRFDYASFKTFLSKTLEKFYPWERERYFLRSLL